MATVGDIVKEFKKIYREYSKYEGKVYVQIDDTGLGGGVTDRLKEVRKEQKLYKMQIIPINAAEKIETDTAAGKDAAEKYNNLTTAMWASMRDLLDNKQIVIEDDEQTVGQLSSRKYTMTSNGKLEIESKKEMKKRGLDSPDRADALSLPAHARAFAAVEDITLALGEVALEHERFFHEILNLLHRNGRGKQRYARLDGGGHRLQRGFRHLRIRADKRFSDCVCNLVAVVRFRLAAALDDLHRPLQMRAGLPRKQSA